MFLYIMVYFQNKKYKQQCNKAFKITKEHYKIHKLEEELEDTKEGLIEEHQLLTKIGMVYQDTTLQDTILIEYIEIIELKIFKFKFCIFY